MNYFLLEIRGVSLLLDEYLFSNLPLPKLNLYMVKLDGLSFGFSCSIKVIKSLSYFE